MTTQTIAITGSTGFVGGRLVTYLAERGYHVLAFGRKERPKSLPATASYFRWDITQGSFGLPENVGKIDAVIHCAGSVSEWGTHRDMYRTNVAGTQNVLHTFRQSRQFIHISTASVYDPAQPKSMLREDAPYAPRYLNEYSLTKQLAEVAVRESSHPNRVILRPHIIYGPGDTTLLPRLQRARRLGRFIAIGDGQNRLSLTYIDNLCLAVELVIHKLTVNPVGLEIFNITDSQTDRLDNILSAFIQAMGYREKLWHLDKKLANMLATGLQTSYRALHLPFAPLLTPYVVAQMASEYTLDISKARQMLGYTPPIDYQTGFARLR